MNAFTLPGFDLDQFIRTTLDEDLGVGLPGGGHDVTSESVIPADARFAGFNAPMKLAILSRAPTAYSTQRLKAAALQRGHDVRVLNTLRFGIDLAGNYVDFKNTTIDRVTAAYAGTAVQTPVVTNGLLQDAHAFVISAGAHIGF